jgi:nucleotide-binding universal stress UspA family protein
MKVLVAVDMGPGSDKVLGFAAALAKQTGGEVHVVHVIGEEEEAARRHRPGPGQYVDVMEEETKFDLVSRLVGLGVAQSSITAIVRFGKPVDEVQKVTAEGDFDALVVGMRRRSRVGKFLLGSVLQELLLSSDRPVVAVPTESPPLDQ